MKWFKSNEDVKDKIEVGKNDYNEFCPHSALTFLTPVEFTRKQYVLAV
jgi:transposase InsO family protein